MCGSISLKDNENRTTTRNRIDVDPHPDTTLVALKMASVEPIEWGLLPK